MQVEIVDVVEHRYIYKSMAPDGTTIAELIPGRSCCAFVLKMPDGKHVVAEVSEEDFKIYLATKH